MFRFLHAADIHLDSPLRGLARYEGAPVEKIRDASRRALENLVALAIQEEVAFVVIAGDVYDGDWRDYNTGQFFAHQMSQLRQANVGVYLVKGNHDAASRITKELRLPDNVYEFPSKKPETVRREDLGVALHGQSFPTGSVTEDLSAAYPVAASGFYNVGILHTSADGREGHDTYAPTTLERLRTRGYDYWALGHVHAREALCSDPHVHFSGVIQGRHIGETGPKGCLLVRVDGHGRSAVAFHALDVVRWSRCEVDGRGKSRGEVLDLFRNKLDAVMDEAEERLCAMRILVHGEHPSVAHDLRAMANDLGDDRVWIEKVQVVSEVTSGAQANLPEGALQELSAVLRDWETDTAALDSVVEELSPLAQKLTDARADAAAMAASPDAVRRYVARARSELLARLLGSGSDS